IKLFKTGTSFMIYFCRRNQSYFKSVFVDTDAVFNIFAQTGKDESSNFFVNFSGNTHVKATWMELSDMLFIAPNAACCKWRCHGVADGFLHRRKTFVCCIWTSKSI